MSGSCNTTICFVNNLCNMFEILVQPLRADMIETPGKTSMYRYPSMTKTMRQKETNKTFILHVEEGSFTDSEIIVMLGENGTGKTTFIRMMAGLLKSDEQAAAEDNGDLDLVASLGVPQLNVRSGLALLCLLRYNDIYQVLVTNMQFLNVYLQLQATDDLPEVPRDGPPTVAQAYS